MLPFINFQAQQALVDWRNSNNGNIKRSYLFLNINKVTEGQVLSWLRHWTVSCLDHSYMILTFFSMTSGLWRPAGPRSLVFQVFTLPCLSPSARPYHVTAQHWPAPCQCPIINNLSNICRVRFVHQCHNNHWSYRLHRSPSPRDVIFALGLIFASYDTDLFTESCSEGP